MTRDPQQHACLILPTTGATYMVITQDFIQSHTRVRMVTVIKKKPHQLLVIKPNYNLKTKKVIVQACPSGSEHSFSITYPVENDVPKLQK